MINQLIVLAVLAQTVMGLIEGGFGGGLGETNAGPSPGRPMFVCHVYPKVNIGPF